MDSDYISDMIDRGSLSAKKGGLYINAVLPDYSAVTLKSVFLLTKPATNAIRCRFLSAKNASSKSIIPLF